MPAPNGTWTINANGFKGALVLTPDAQGNLSGTVFGDQLRGFWDEGAQKITFIRANNPSNPNNVQIYTGFLFVSNSPLFPAPHLLLPNHHPRHPTSGSSRATSKHSQAPEGDRNGTSSDGWLGRMCRRGPMMRKSGKAR